jgi:hypothetical protein
MKATLMKATPAHALPPPAASRHPRAGLSLLEVLVAGGILAVGLASVSALLPAASTRLGQATQQDRAGVLAASARAECVNRGLVAADIFSSSTSACVFGALAGMPATGVLNVALDLQFLRMGIGLSRSTSTGVRCSAHRANRGASEVWVWDDPGSAAQNGVIFIKGRRYLYRGFGRPAGRTLLAFTGLSPTLEEDLVDGDEVFVVDTSTGFRMADDPAFCWGAMLTPASGGTTSGTAAAGLPATLSIAVFRKAPTISGTIALTGGTSSPRFQLTSGTIYVWQGPGWASINPNEASRRQFLPPCSHAVALTNPPRWVRVTSSWTMPGPITSGSENVAGRRSFVVLDPNPLTGSGTTVNVIGFDGLLRVDHHPVTLD